MKRLGDILILLTLPIWFFAIVVYAAFCFSFAVFWDLLEGKLFS
jgi:hypothetical protein